MIYDRNKKEHYDEKESKMIKFLYNNSFGKIINNFINRKCISIIIEKYMSSIFSRRMIRKTIEKNNINMNEFVEKEYKNFNEFFNRKINLKYRPIPKNEEILISPCDAKLSVYKITDGLHLTIKNNDYTINSLLKDDEISQKYEDGYCLVFRLCIDDYHSYYYIDDGKLLEHKTIKGRFNSVRPTCLRNKKIFAENNREWSLLKTKNFKDVVYMEVGALGVGKINNKNLNSFHRSDEKGYFSFGGSTIILLFQKDVIKIDDDLIKESSMDNEIQVKLFERIGIKKAR